MKKIRETTLRIARAALARSNLLLHTGQGLAPKWRYPGTSRSFSPVTINALVVRGEARRVGDEVTAKRRVYVRTAPPLDQCKRGHPFDDVEWFGSDRRYAQPRRRCKVCIKQRESERAKVRDRGNARTRPEPATPAHLAAQMAENPTKPAV